MPVASKGSAGELALPFCFFMPGRVPMADDLVKTRDINGAAGARRQQCPAASSFFSAQPGFLSLSVIRPPS